MSRRYMTKAEHNAILCGLRCLQQVRQQCAGDLTDDLQEILSDDLEDGDDITDEEIDQLCEDINMDEVQLTVEEDEDDEG